MTSEAVPAVPVDPPTARRKQARLMTVTGTLSERIAAMLNADAFVMVSLAAAGFAHTFMRYKPGEYFELARNHKLIGKSELTTLCVAARSAGLNLYVTDAVRLTNGTWSGARWPLRRVNLSDLV
jgi:hypothetical protein